LARLQALPHQRLQASLETANLLCCLAAFRSAFWYLASCGLGCSLEQTLTWLSSIDERALLGFT
jgi:hypothetical protein